MTTDFAVLLPVYDGDDPQFARRAFESVTVEQQVAPTEVIVVRDGPLRSELAAVVDGFSDTGPSVVRTVALAENVGLARALTAGLAACSAEIVARQDADDISCPNRFAVQVPLIAGGLDLVGSAIEEFDEEDHHGGLVRTPPLSAAQIDRDARFRSPFNHPSVVYRKTAVTAAGGYEDLPLMEDYWLFVRMLAAGARALNVAEPLVRYRIGAGAYGRRGGRRLLRSELDLQRRMRRIGFTTNAQWLRNSVLRGGYRLVPEQLRRGAYRADARRR